MNQSINQSSWLHHHLVVRLCFNILQFFLNITSYQFELAFAKLLQQREYRAQNVFAPLLPRHAGGARLLVFVNGVLVAVSCAARLRHIVVVVQRTPRPHLLYDVRLLMLLPRGGLLRARVLLLLLHHWGVGLRLVRVVVVACIGLLFLLLVRYQLLNLLLIFERRLGLLLRVGRGH